jgi:rhamnosyl/mannosyltransferase
METVVADLCDGTADGWDVRVVAANDGRATVRDVRGRVTVDRAATWHTKYSVPLCPSFPRLLWRERADCVVLHEPNPVAGCSTFLHTPAPHLIVWHHADLLRPAWAPHTYGLVQRALYRRADCVIVSSPRLADDSALVGCARRVAVIPFGIDLERYRDERLAASSRVRELIGRAPGPRVLFVGRLVYYKGVHILLDALARCGGTLILVGDGPLEGELRARAAALGIADRVIFAGHVADDDLPAYYKAADVFVLPSIARTEAFGVVQIEAMAAGVPVVSTNLPTGVPWVNSDGISGIVVPPGDSAALAAAIDRLGRDPALRSSLGANAAARAGALFSRQRMLDAFRRVVETVVHAPAELDREISLARKALS